MKSKYIVQLLHCSIVTSPSPSPKRRGNRKGKVNNLTIEQCNNRFSLGFTLIELLVVMAILGILLTGIIIAVNPVRNINQGKDSTVKFDMAQIVRALKAYQTVTHGLYPPLDTPPLQNLVASGELDELPKQPDGTDYNYQRSSTCDASGCEAIVWAKLYNAPDGTQWCWDSTNNKYKESPNPPTGITCP